MIRFTTALLAVKDVEVSKAFYRDLFDQTVTLDLGRNVTLSGGFALQQGFDWLTGVSPESMRWQSHNMELYFEVDDFNDFLLKLAAHPEARLVHPPKKHAWQQRVVRLYDPDGHMIEVGEAMAVIARRYLAQGYSVEETAKIIQHPVEFVRVCREEKA